MSVSPQGRGGQHTGVSSCINVHPPHPHPSFQTWKFTSNYEFARTKPLVAKLSGLPQARLLAFHLPKNSPNHPISCLLAEKDSPQSQGSATLFPPVVPPWGHQYHMILMGQFLVLPSCMPQPAICVSAQHRSLTLPNLIV